MKDEKIFVCVAKCPELDLDKDKHCRATLKEINFQNERYPSSGCPCGNTPVWVDSDRLIAHDLRNGFYFK